MADDPPVISLRKSTVVRVGIALAVLAALGVGVAIGLLAGGSSSPTVKISTASAHKHGSKSAPLASTTTTAAPAAPVTTTTAARAPVAAVTTPTTAARAPVVPVTTTTVNAARAILAPATTPPVVNECSIALTYSADGNPVPAFCPNGGINVLAWNYMATNYPNILSAGANASEAQVLQTMCEGTIVGGEVELTAQVEATYYGWSFANDPAFTGWRPGDCS